MDLKNANRIVIKIGSALLVDQKTGALKETWLKSLSDDISALRKQGKDIIIVSSGAVGLGRKYLNLPRNELRLEEKQAAAACGQVELLRHFRRIFETQKLKTAQTIFGCIVC